MVDLSNICVFRDTGVADFLQEEEKKNVNNTKMPKKRVPLFHPQTTLPVLRKVP